MNVKTNRQTGVWKRCLGLIGIIAALTLSGASALATESAPSKTANLKDGVVLQGYDPVSYFKGDRPQKGQPGISAVDSGIKYLFANEGDRTEFLKNPKKYAPAYEGWCATAVANGYKYDIDPENYKITDGRLFLFYKGWKGDAKRDWVKDEPAQAKLADKNWPQVRESKE